MRIAHQFGRHDVHAFLHEIDADQFERWVQFFALEPAGWQADQIMTQRISYVVAQSQSPKRLKERDYLIEFRLPPSPEMQRLQFEAFSVQAEVAAAMAKGIAEGEYDG